MSRWLLQNLFVQHISKCPEVNWVLNFLFTFKPTLCTLLVYAVCDNNCKVFCMEHLLIPILPWSIEYYTIVYEVVHQIYFEIRYNVDTLSIIYFDTPRRLVVSASLHFMSSFYFVLSKGLTVEMLHDKVDWKETCAWWYACFPPCACVSFTATTTGFRKRSSLACC